MTNNAAEIIEFPRPTAADDVVRASVRALIAAAGLTPTEAAPLVGMNDDTLRRRLKSKGERQAFTAGELARIAERFNVPVGALFSGLGGFFGPNTRSGRSVGDYGSEGWGFESLRARSAIDRPRIGDLIPLPGERRRVTPRPVRRAA